MPMPEGGNLEIGVLGRPGPPGVEIAAHRGSGMAGSRQFAT